MTTDTSQIRQEDFVIDQTYDKTNLKRLRLKDSSWIREDFQAFRPWDLLLSYFVVISISYVKKLMGVETLLS